MRLSLNTAQPEIWEDIQANCCSASGVTCSNSRVAMIKWFNYGLTGSINNVTYPSALEYLILHTNPNLSGSISSLPPTLIRLDLAGNSHTGDVPPLPDTLTELRLGWPGNSGNHFTGSIRLNQPLDLMINDNWLTDIIIQDVSKLTSDKCDLSNNPLLGNPNIAGMNCSKNALYSASLLPNTNTLSSSVSKSFSLVPSSITVILNTETEVSNNNIPSDVDPNLIYGLLSGFLGVFVIAFLANKFLKVPKIKSKFARKNSYGTLNTMSTVNTVNK